MRSSCLKDSEAACSARMCFHIAATISAALTASATACACDARRGLESCFGFGGPKTTRFLIHRPSTIDRGVTGAGLASEATAHCEAK